MKLPSAVVVWRQRLRLLRPRPPRRMTADVAAIYSKPEVVRAAPADLDRIEVVRLRGRFRRAANRDVVEARAHELAAIVTGRVLEVGASAGVTTAAVADLIGHDRIVALDRSLEACRVARDHARVRVVCADAAALPFRDGAFDTVMTCSVLYTLEGLLERALNEIRRVGRCFVFMEPLYEFLSWFERRHFLHKGFTSPVLPRLRTIGFTVERCDESPQSGNPLVRYWTVRAR